MTSDDRVNTDYQGEEEEPLLQFTDKPSMTMWLAIMVTTCATFTFGYTLGYTSPTIVDRKFCNPLEDHHNLDALNCKMNMSDDEMTWFGSIVNLGALTGALLGGRPVDKFGRKFGMFAAYLFFCLGYTLLATAKVPSAGHTGNIGLLLSLRFLLGCGIGFVCCAINNYQVDIAPLRMRGAIGTLFQVGIVFGICSVYALGLFMKWRSLAILCLIVSAAGLVLTLFIPESPAWLLSKERKEEAEKAVRRLRTDDSDIKAIMEALAVAIGADEEIEVEAAVDIDEAKRRMSAGRPRAPSSTSYDAGDITKGSFRDLVKAPRVKALLIGVGLMFVQQLSGINAVMFYASKILQTVWPNPDTANKWALGCQILQLIVTVASAPLMETAGRKLLLTIASFGMVICCGLLGVYYLADGLPKALVVIPFYFYVMCFSCGMGAIPWFIMGEIFHTEVKGLCSSIATAVNWSLAFGITKTVTLMEDNLGGMGGVFLSYGGVCLLGIFFIQLCIPETKGKPYMQIERELLGEKDADEGCKATDL